MENKEKIEKNDFIEIEFTGYYEGKVFDSNIPEDLKQLSPKAKPEKTAVIIGQGMVVPGLDKSLEGKEIGKEYRTNIKCKEAFGERKKEMVKIIPLSQFTKQNINPKPGMAVFLDNFLARIITISGARVITDFNNPLAGKDIEYKFKIIKKITGEKEKIEIFFNFFFRFIPEFEIKESAIAVKGQKNFEVLINLFKDKFKELLRKDLELKIEGKPAREKPKEIQEEAK